MSDTSDSDLSIEDVTDISSTNHQKLPEKSKKKYEKTYQNFMEWKTSKSFTSFSEKVLLTFFEELSAKFKSTSLWTTYSKLKMMLNIKHEVDIGKYAKVSGLLKRKSEGHTRKKSKMFSAEEINKFLKEAPDDVYLLTKVALVFGVLGACRRQELHKLKFSDVEVFGSTILVKINNHKSNPIRTFTVIGKNCNMCKKYISLRPENCSSIYFFLNYKFGKCTGLNLGINKLGGLAKSIARYLELPEHELYTGQCFRRSAKSVFVDAEGNIRDLRDNRRFAALQRTETNKDDKTESNNDEKIDSNNDDKIDSNNDDQIESNNDDQIESNNDDQIETTENYINIKIEHVESIENDKCEIVTEDFLDNLIENTNQVTNENLNAIEKDVFEFINVPSTCNSQNSNSNDRSKSETVAEEKVDSIDDSMKHKPQIRNQMFNTISNQTIEVVNINIPNIADLPSTFVPVHFDNCTIRNVNYYYNK